MRTPKKLICKNDKNYYRVSAPTLLKRRRSPRRRREKSFLLIEMIEKGQGGGKSPTVILWTFHGEAIRGTVTQIHSRYLQYLGSLYKRTFNKHARAHTRARERTDQILQGKGPRRRIHEDFLIQAAERLRRKIKKEEGEQ